MDTAQRIKVIPKTHRGKPEICKIERTQASCLTLVALS